MLFRSVAQELGFETIWVISLGNINDHEALLMLQAANTLRSFTFLAECKGLANLYRQGMTTKELAKQFGWSTSQIGDMVSIGHFPEQTLQAIEESIRTSEQQAKVWTHFLLVQLLPLREVLPGQSLPHGHSWQSLDHLYDYREIDQALKEVISGKITKGEEMRTYVINRKYEIYQARFDQDLQRKLADKIAQVEHDLEVTKAKYLLEKEKESQQREQKTQERYESQITALQEERDDLKKRYKKLVDDVNKKPEIIAELEQELQEKLQKAEVERERWQDLQQSLEEDAAREQTRREEELRRAKQQLEEEVKQALDEGLAAQQEEQSLLLKKAEEELKKFYEQKDQQKQFEAENTIRGLLSHGVQSLAKAQKALDHIVSRSMIDAVLELGGPQHKSLLEAMNAMRDALERAEEKLTNRKSILYVEGGIVNGHTAHPSEFSEGPNERYS